MKVRHVALALVGIAVGLLVAGGVGLTGRAEAAPATDTGWRAKLTETLPLYGHRNWIAVVDSAYPAQTREGVETVVTGADQVEVVRAVLDAVEKSPHVQPVVFTDAELPYVPEQYAKGIGNYRKQLNSVLGKREVNVLPHEEIIKQLDEAGETFRVLILKTNLTLPYTSVFLRLDCGYWSPEAETALRDAMAAPPK